MSRGGTRRGCDVGRGRNGCGTCCNRHADTHFFFSSRVAVFLCAYVSRGPGAAGIYVKVKPTRNVPRVPVLLEAGVCLVLPLSRRAVGRCGE